LRVPHNAGMERPRDVHVVFGAGQIGTPLAERLLGAGHEVRVVRRSPGTPAAGATLRTGDAANAKFVEEATSGASVLYHCMNPPYSASVWARELPRWRQAMLAPDQLRQRVTFALSQITVISTADAGLQVSTLRLDGIVRAPNGMIAVVSNPQSRTYFLREGDHLYDGSVEKITMDGVSFHEEGKDAFGKPVQREVNKRIYSTSSGEQQ